MSVQYRTGISLDTDLIDLDFVNTSSAPKSMKGLVKQAVKITVGAPKTTAKMFMIGAKVINAVSGIHYINTGTVTAPFWSIVSVI